MSRHSFARPVDFDPETLPPPPPFPQNTEYYFHDPDDASNISTGDENASGVAAVKAGTLEKLVERLTFHLYPDPDYLRTFLLTYRSFTRPIELLELLISRYSMPPPPDAISVEAQESFREQILTPVRLRVFNVLRIWIKEHFYDFGADSGQLEARALDFIQNVMVHSGMKRAAIQLQDLIANKKEGGETRHSKIFSEVPPDPMVPDSMSTDDMELMSLPSLEIARQLTLIEYDLWTQIKPWECLGQGWTKKRKMELSPNIVRMIHRSTFVSYWVATTIVSSENIDSRKAVICKWIDIMGHLRDLQNYNAMMEIWAGLSGTPVFRLKQTWGAIPKKHMETLENHKEIISADKNYGRLRSHLLELSPPCIPYLGMFLTDLTFIEDGIGDLEAGGLINFSKRQKVAAVIGLIMRFQQTPYCIISLDNLQSYCSEVNVYESDDMLYKLSCIREPRSGSAGTSSEMNTSQGSVEDSLLDSIPLVQVDGYRFYAKDSPDNLRIETDDHGKPIIMAATVEKLVERLTYEKFPDHRYVHTFLDVFPVFISNFELLELLRMRFNSPLPDTNNSNLLKHYMTRTVKPVRFRVYNVLKQWLERDETVISAGGDAFVSALRGFLEDEMLTEMEKPASNLLKQLDRAIDRTEERHAARMAEEVMADGTIDLFSVDAAALARQLTLMAFQRLRVVQPYELLFAGNLEHVSATNLFGLVTFLKGITFWVKHTIMDTGDDDDQRAATVAKLMEVAQICFEHRDYATADAIVLGVQRSAAVIPSDYFAFYGEASSLFLRDAGFSAFRNHRAERPNIPLIAMYLYDVADVYAQHTDPGEDLIDFARLRAATDVLRAFTEDTAGSLYNFENDGLIRAFVADFVEDYDPDSSAEGSA